MYIMGDDERYEQPGILGKCQKKMPRLEVMAGISKVDLRIKGLIRGETETAA